MPMTFPTLESLTQRATQRHFRQPYTDETVENYRANFADFMQKIDMVEAGEIRMGGITPIPLHFVRKADPMLALSAIMGKTPDEMNEYLNDVFSDQIKTLNSNGVQLE